MKMEFLPSLNDQYGEEQGEELSKTSLLFVRVRLLCFPTECHRILQHQGGNHELLHRPT